MALNHSSLSITYIDFDLERTTIQIDGAPVLDDGTNLPAILAAMDAVEAAVDALAIGTKVSVQRVFQTDIFERTRPDEAAQRECKLFITGHKLGAYTPKKLTLGTFDLTLLATPPAGTNLPSYLDLSAGAGAALKAALEDYWTCPDNYLVSVVVDAAYHVGRNT